MKYVDIVELLDEQELADPLPNVPKGRLGQVTSMPPALWVFTFPGRYAGPVRLQEVRVVHGPRAWIYRVRTYYRHQVRPRYREGSMTLAMAVVGPAAGVAIGGTAIGPAAGAAIGGMAGLAAGGAMNLAWKRFASESKPMRRRPRTR
jgi:hypothetical protein